MIDMVVHHTLLVDQGNDHMWMVRKDIHRAGEVLPWMDVFPRWYLESIAAELDIEYTDTATLLDIAIYRPSLPDHPGWADGSWLYGAPSIQAARESHLALIAECKAGGRLRGVAGKTPAARRVADQPDVRFLLDSDDHEHADPLDLIVEHSPIDPEYMAVRREIRNHHREMYREAHRLASAARAAPVDLTARESVERFRARVLDNRRAPHDPIKS